MSYRTVRLRAELLPHIEKAIEQEKDEFGVPRFRSRADFVTEAVKELLKELAKAKR